MAPSGCFRSDPRLFPARSPDGIRSGAGPRTYDSRPARRKCLRCYSRWASGDSCLDSIGPVRLLATVSSDRLRIYTPVGDALALGTFRTRLETRTKESSMFASHRDSNETYRRNESEGRAQRAPREEACLWPSSGLASHSRGVSCSSRAEAHPERTCWDPKDGELCLVRTKSGETLMEVRSDSDVQIDRRNWV